MSKINKGKSVAGFIIRYLIITFAALVYAVGIALFLDPNNMAPGGVAGIAVVLNRVIPVSTGMLILLLNIPIILLGLWKFGWRFILSTIYTIVVSSVAIDVIGTHFKCITNDHILAALIGGSLIGAGIGIVFRQDSTTGGIDVIVKMLRQRFPQMKSGEMFLIMDALILIASAFVFKDIEIALYAAVAIFVSTLVMDKVLYGSDGAKLVYIVSDRRKIISTRILKELHIGVTLVEGMGAYKMEHTEIIMCVMRKQMLPKVRNIVREVDENAFVIVSSATEVFGLGFKGHNDEEI